MSLRFINVERSIVVVAGPFPGWDPGLCDAERAEQQGPFMALCFLIVDVMQPATQTTQP